MTRLNVPHARRTLEWLEAHPETHRQLQWTNACGTKMCVAGHAAVLNGARFITRGELSRLWNISIPGDLTVLSDHIVAPELTRPMRAETYAKQTLGLTGEQARRLFYIGAEASAVAYLREIIAEAESEKVTS